MLLQNYPVQDSFQLKKEQKIMNLKRIGSQHILLYSLYVLIAIIFLISFVYSQKVLKNIEEKKKNLYKLEQTYSAISMENEKLDILLTEIKNKNYHGKQFLKMVGSLNLKKEAEKIAQDYSGKDDNFFHGYSKLIFWTILGIILLGITRLLYLDFFSRKR